MSQENIQGTERKVKVLSRVDTKENWETINPELLDKEIGYERETGRYKIGDGINYWNDLPYCNLFEDLISTTLFTSNWNSNIYSFEDIYPAEKYDIEIFLNGDLITIEQKEAYADAQIVGSFNNNSIKALDTIPAIDIPIILRVVKK